MIRATQENLRLGNVKQMLASGVNRQKIYFHFIHETFLGLLIPPSAFQMNNPNCGIIIFFPGFILSDVTEITSSRLHYSHLHESMGKKAPDTVLMILL